MNSVESIFTELFGARIRYSAAALGRQLGAAITGFTPLIAGALFAVGGWLRKAIAEMEPVERQVIAESRVQ